ncbi:helix-turn-helix domain-containing protein [Flavobacterium sp. '19STA2R22 D10 B1']|uniref:helix-turn-helix domain-containing protein n=1 Tax=Flavobacterium aerium TaxID=3037261 RepID=UPI00278BB5EC|nr:AraC family transcriptional regulator [Flavobacterium sp. '19STA2R22 D10 B1']
MKTITHHYGVELDWVETLAEQLEGKVEGNFIIVPDHIHTGIRYFLNCGLGISVLYLDVLYHSEIRLRQENKTNDFIGIYYNLTEGDATLLSGYASNSIGRWSYNLAIIDSSLKTDYIVKPGSTTFALCIFIKKEVIRDYIRMNPSLREHTDKLFDSRANTIVKFTRMSNESYHLMNNLRAQTVGGSIFDLYLKGTVQSLLANYIEHLKYEDMVIDTVNEQDLTAIISSQAYLIENVTEIFPSIVFLSQQVNMSESKYKSLFKKITGMTPHVFFRSNKLLKARELLQGRQLSVTEVSDALNFTNNAYFANQFKEYFGMSPKTFLKHL